MSLVSVLVAAEWTCNGLALSFRVFCYVSCAKTHKTSAKFFKFLFCMQLLNNRDSALTVCWNCRASCVQCSS